MKKLFAVLAAMMVLAMGTTVFAAVSPDDQDGYTEAEKQAVGSIDMEKTAAVDVSGNAIGITVKPVSRTEHLANNATAQEAAEKALSNGEISLELKENQTPKADVLGVVEVKAPDGTQYPVTLTIPVSGVKQGDTVLVLHYVDGKWENLIPTLVANGYVKATFYSFSPIAVVLVEAADSITPPDDDNKSTEDNPDDVTNANNGDSNSSINNSGNITNIDNSQNINVTDNSRNTTINNYNDQADTKSDAAGTGSKNAGSQKAVSNAELTSPKTGQAVPKIKILAAFCAAGILVCGLKVKEAKQIL